MSVTVASILLAAACGSSGTTSSGAATSGTATSPSPTVPAPAAGTAAATVGPLHISGAYIPQPASPDVAAAYFTVTNSAATADTLVRASTPDAGSVTAHDTVTTAAGAEEMVPLAASTVPAGGSLVFAVGARHLMLMNPAPHLVAGDRVPLTLVFAHAGTVTLQVPVTGLTGPSGGTGATPAPGTESGG